MSEQNKLIKLAESVRQKVQDYINSNYSDTNRKVTTQDVANSISQNFNANQIEKYYLDGNANNNPSFIQKIAESQILND